MAKAKEDAWKEKEEEHKACKHLWNEWEHIELNIRQLSNALSFETDEFIKHDMQTDIIVLINRKKLLANKLNYN